MAARTSAFTSYADAKAWLEGGTKRLLILTDTQCSACATWLAETLPTYDIGTWLWSTLPIETWVSDAEDKDVVCYTGVAATALHRWPLGAIMTEVQVKEFLALCEKDESIPRPGAINSSS